MTKPLFQKRTIWAFIALAMTATIAASMAAPVFADEAMVEGTYLYARAGGWAFERIDNETIRQKPVQLNITLNLGSLVRNHRLITGVNGTLDVNGTIFAIQSGQGIIITGVHVALVRCSGVDADGNEIGFAVRAAYFWWGGSVYAFRAVALLRTVESPMMLLMRGVAKVY